MIAAAALVSTAAQARPTPKNVVGQYLATITAEDGSNRELCLSFTDHIWDANSEPGSSERMLQDVIIKQVGGAGSQCESWLMLANGELKTCESATYLMSNPSNGFATMLASGLAGRTSGSVQKDLTYDRTQQVGNFRIHAVASCD
jgi:hypothetical protein